MRATRACLAGSTRIHLHKLASGAFCLVREFAEEGAPACIIYRTGHHPTRHPLDVQIFHGDNAVAVHQPTADVVVKGRALVADLAVRLGDQHASFPAPVASPLPPRQLALRAPEASKAALQLPGIVDFGSVRQRGEAVQTNVNSDLGPDTSNGSGLRSTEKHTYQ